MSLSSPTGIADGMLSGRHVRSRARDVPALIFPIFMALSALGILIGSGRKQTSRVPA